MADKDKVWPRCVCGHLAQDHDEDECCHVGRCQCPKYRPRTVYVLASGEPVNA